MAREVVSGRSAKSSSVRIDHLAAADVVALGDVVVADLFAVDLSRRACSGSGRRRPGAPGGSGCPSPRSRSRASRAMDTRPNETAPFQIARMPPLPLTRPSDQDVIPSTRLTRGVRRAIYRLSKVPARRCRSRCSPRPAALPAGPRLGVRVQVGRRSRARRFRGGRQRLYARSGAEITVAYPELAPARRSRSRGRAARRRDRAARRERPAVVHGAGRADARARHRPGRAARGGACR